MHGRTVRGRGGEERARGLGRARGAARVDGARGELGGHQPEVLGVRDQVAAIAAVPAGDGARGRVRDREQPDRRRAVATDDVKLNDPAGDVFRQPNDEGATDRRAVEDHLKAMDKAWMDEAAE